MSKVLSSNKRKSTTVCFNVGGKLYEVAQSLLEQHPDTMLARLASDTWLPDGGSGVGDEKKDDGKVNDGSTPGDDNDTALFIERNGERFQYCLDYMRDGGTVHLPPNIPKDALLQDLAYYGFENTDPSKIIVTGSIPMFGTCFSHLKSFEKTLDDEIRELEIKWKSRALAKHCICYYTKFASLDIHVPNTDECKEMYYMTNANNFDEVYGQQFNECLERIGLKCKSVKRRKVYLDHL